MPSVVTNGDNPSTAIQKPLIRPTINAATSPARIEMTRIRPGTLASTVLPSAARCTNSEAPGIPGVDRPDITIEVIMAEKHIIEPTDRSMPPVMITNVIPRVAMAMNEKFFATFCMLPSVKKYGLAKCMTTSSSSSASVT